MVLYFSNIPYFFIKALDLQLPIVFQSLLLESHSNISAMIRPDNCFLRFNRGLVGTSTLEGYLQGHGGIILMLYI